MYEARQNKQNCNHTIQSKHKSTRLFKSSCHKNDNPIQRALHVTATCCIGSLEESARSQNLDKKPHHWVLDAMNSIARRKNKNELFQCAEPKSLDCVLKKFENANLVITRNDVQTIHWKNVKYYYIEGESQDKKKSENEKSRERTLNGKNANLCATCLTWIGKNFRPLPDALQAVDNSVPSELKDFYNGFQKINQIYDGPYSKVITIKRKIDNFTNNNNCIVKENRYYRNRKKLIIDLLIPLSKMGIWNTNIVSILNGTSNQQQKR